MTQWQEELFYRKALRESLGRFYGKSSAEAARLVRDWWERMQTRGLVTCGLFLHNEPINTAGDIAATRIVELDETARTAYEVMLQQSWQFALTATQDCDLTQKRANHTAVVQKLRA